MENVNLGKGALVENIEIYQIFYNESTKAILDPLFIPLDNTNSTKPDWFEYWPIRNKLLQKNLNEDGWLGFFSPRFEQKTGLNASSVLEIVRRSGSDIISFSPCYDQNCLFINSFHQGEANHPGFFSVSKKVLDSLGVPVDITSLVQDSTRTIFSNFFVARTSFWKKWLALSSDVYSWFEDEKNFFQSHAEIVTTHRGKDYPMKIFFMERVVSILLELEGLDADVSHGVEGMPLANPKCRELYGGLLLLDALKGQCIKTRSQLFLQHYKFHQEQILSMLR